MQRSHQCRFPVIRSAVIGFKVAHLCALCSVARGLDYLLNIHSLISSM